MNAKNRPCVRQEAVLFKVKGDSRSEAGMTMRGPFGRLRDLKVEQLAYDREPKPSSES